MTRGCCGVQPAASGYTANGYPTLGAHRIVAEVVQLNRDSSHEP
jgi:hypothetical protein